MTRRRLAYLSAVIFASGSLPHAATAHKIFRMLKKSQHKSVEDRGAVILSEVEDPEDQGDRPTEVVKNYFGKEIKMAHFRSGPPTGDSHCSASLVFDIGLPRTATVSFADHFRKLGYTTTHIDAEHMTESMAFKAGNYTGTYFTQDLWKQDKHAFADWPYFAIACELLAVKPEATDAKFVLVERDLDEYTDSFRTVYCKYRTCYQWDYPLSNFFYGEHYQRGCAVDHDLMCEGEAKTNQYWSGLRDSWKEFAVNHTNRIKACFDEREDSLLVVNLEDSDESKAQGLHDFLGCSGPTAAFERTIEHEWYNGAS